MNNQNFTNLGGNGQINPSMPTNGSVPNQNTVNPGTINIVPAVAPTSGMPDANVLTNGLQTNTVDIQLQQPQQQVGTVAPAPTIAPVPSNITPQVTSQVPQNVAVESQVQTQAVSTGQVPQQPQTIQQFDPFATTQAPNTNTAPASIGGLSMSAPVNMVQPDKETVGAVPPEKPKENKLAKFLKFLIVIALIGGIGYGVYYAFNYFTTQVSVKTKHIDMDINSELSTNIEYYGTLTNTTAKNCVLNTNSVDTTKEGTYTYTITCNDKTFEGTIGIIDNVELVAVSNQVNLKVGENIQASDFITSCSKENCSYEFENAELVEQYINGGTGVYDITVIISDGKNELMVTEKLYIFVQILSAKVSTEVMSDYTGIIVQRDKIYIGDNNLYEGTSFRTYEYTFTNVDDYNSVKEEYQYASEYDNKPGTLTFDDEKSMLSVAVPLTIDTLNIEADGEFPTEYASIYSYYVSKGAMVSIVNN